eukprot:12061335-Karenia_brevis.AAC.1
MVDISESTFTQVSPRQKKDYISEDTWKLIEKRDEETDYDAKKSFTREIKRRARKDRENANIEILENITDERTAWRNIKAQKLEYKPQPNIIEDMDGNRRSIFEKSDVIATYLEQQHWKNDETIADRMHEPNIRNTVNIDCANIYLAEINEAINKLKKNKAAGPDQTFAEFYQYLNIDNRMIIHKILDFCWQNHIVPEIMNDANIVTLYKKGNPAKPENYRPIALLNMLYKIYTIIIRERLKPMDQYIRSTQFGFRKNRSTQQPLFAIRRAMDYIEASQDKCVLTLLDWEKAFDKVNQKRLIIALRRFGIPDKICKNIGAIYAGPKFKVFDDLSTSDIKRQHAGIRQGCPLSPYLFIILLTVMFDDIHRKNPNLRKSHIAASNWTDLLYADDTLLIMKSTQQMNKLIWQIEIESEYYNLKLNKDKCIILEMKGTFNVRFRDNVPLKKKDHAKYLGAILQNTAERVDELKNRIRDTILWVRNAKHP